MAKIMSFKSSAELVMTDEEGYMSLTRRIGFFQMLMVKWEQNVRINKIKFQFESRAGAIASGTVEASIIDNRIDSETTNNVLQSITFGVRQNVEFTWEHDVSLHVNDLKSKSDDPIILKTYISDCNMRPGYSLGQMRIVMEIATSRSMMRRRAKEPVARLMPSLISQDRETSNHISLLDRESKVGRSGRLAIKEKENDPSKLTRSASVSSVQRKPRYYITNPTIDS